MAVENKLNLGKKIFFINPSFDIRNRVIPLLATWEFEVYTVVNYQYTKELLQKYPDSICFVCIDDQLTINAWSNFIIAISNNPSFNTVFMGVLSATASSNHRAHLLLNANIPAGFISLNENKAELPSKIEQILVLNEAKGVRKFVRATCNKNRALFLQYKRENKFFRLFLQDISSAGLLCVTQLQNKEVFKENMLLKNIDIQLFSTKVKCNAVVLRTYEKDNLLYIAILFTKGLPFTVKADIQTFIQRYLQANLEKEVLSMELDTTDYTQKITEVEVIEEFLDPIDDAEDLEEIPVMYADDVYEEDIQLIDDTL